MALDIIHHWILFCCLLSLGSAWTQPSTCYVRQLHYPDVNGANKLDKIQETLSDMANSLNRLVDVFSQVPATETTTSTLNTDTEAATMVAPATASSGTDTPTTETPATDTPTTTEAATIDTQTTEAASPSETCGGQGWRQVAFVNMTDPNQDCPQGLNLTDYSIRSCGRSVNGLGVCSSVVFPVNGSSYSQVCGRVTAYRWGLNYAFLGYHDRGETIEGYYVDGLSLTHGSPRTHIWSFTGGTFSGTSSRDAYANERCPCDPGNTYGSPPFVDNDYFCESVATVDNWNANRGQLFPDNALWDGQDHLNACYGLNGPPWFNKTLPVITSNDIDLRLCFADPATVSDIGIQQLELYVY